MSIINQKEIFLKNLVGNECQNKNQNKTDEMVNKIKEGNFALVEFLNFYSKTSRYQECLKEIREYFFFNILEHLLKNIYFLNCTFFFLFFHFIFSIENLQVFLCQYCMYPNIRIKAKKKFNGLSGILTNKTKKKIKSKNVFFT